MLIMHSKLVPVPRKTRAAALPMFPDTPKARVSFEKSGRMLAIQKALTWKGDERTHGHAPEEAEDPKSELQPDCEVCKLHLACQEGA
eukprot:2882069-Rhodomonas_salina.1